MTLASAVARAVETNEDLALAPGAAGTALSQSCPLSQPHETCVTLSWFRLCLQALQLTGEAQYAEAMERTLHNALLGALQPDGHCCCVMSGYRAWFPQPTLDR